MICRNLVCFWKQRDRSRVDNVSIAVTWTKTTFATLSEQTARHAAKPSPQASRGQGFHSQLAATVFGDYYIVRSIKSPQDGSDIREIQEREIAWFKSTQISLMSGWSADQPKAAPGSAPTGETCRWSLWLFIKTFLETVSPSHYLFFKSDLTNSTIVR